MRLFKNLLLATAFFIAVVNYHYYSIEWVRFALMCIVGAYIMVLIVEELRRPKGTIQVTMNVPKKLLQMLARLIEKTGGKVTEPNKLVARTLALTDCLVSGCLEGNNRVKIGNDIDGWKDVYLMESLNGGPIDEIEGLD